ncbi:zinc-ribbon domain-containing protein [Bacillus cereus group sp. TH152-1LC]|uniref:zinc-ribbon domain-containing protein n=1 Tax=Bacillus cereus group sp. TH152-1LC TaxID=3018060 RepID=UPI0022E54393|nr:zinc-ribbon domain-containing protein [Bacillus cereus group sp. TH152-1LC]MDA1674585.1 zinc-ribbon domain-containing protein [Bacillus cereus group sp. TH152-1LC]
MSRTKVSLVGKKVWIYNCLATVKPEIAKQWHPTKNIGKTIYTVAAHSNKKVWWICPKGHEYYSTPNSRKNPYRGCNNCRKEQQTSFPEQAIYYYIKQIFPESENRFVLQFDKKNRCEIDVYIPSLKLGIEYDGIFHKNNKSGDEKKNKLLKENGIYLIRLREGNLPELNLYGSIYFRLIDDSYSELSKSIKKLFDYISVHHELNKEQKNIISQIKVDLKKDEVNIFKKYIEMEKKNSLAFKFPEMSKEWHPDLNEGLKPEFFTAYTSKRVWWKCEQGHEWKTSISNRTLGGNGCKYCAGQAPTKENCLATRYPEVAKQWDYEKNNPVTPNDKMPGSVKKVWWKCEKGHSYPMAISKKVNSGNRCPVCNGKRVTKENCLATVNPELSKEWNYEKNKELTPELVTSGSSKKVWWVCRKNPNHEWEARIKKRNKGQGCGFCLNKRITEENCLATIIPGLASLWHPIKNKHLTPYNVPPNSNKKVWWKCEKGHEWTARINDRVRDGKVSFGCSICSNRKAGTENNISVLFPNIVKDWDESKNDDKNPENFVPGSSIKVWWNCSKGHEEHEQIRYRIRRKGCKECKKLKI